MSKKLQKICQDEPCTNPATHKLINGEESQYFCRTCFFAQIDDLVENNDSISFLWQEDEGAIFVCEVE